MTITHEEIEKLRFLAEKATPGPWYHKHGLSDEESGIPGGVWPELVCEDNDGETSMLCDFGNSNRPDADIAFVASANPEVIKDLCRLALRGLEADGLVVALQHIANAEGSRAYVAHDALAAFEKAVGK